MTNMKNILLRFIGYSMLFLPAHTFAQLPEAGDVIINEILFSAKTGGAEFIEIFNRSSKTIDLSGLRITKRNLTTLQTETPVPLTSLGLLIPQSYLVLTKN